MTELATLRLFATHPHDCSYLPGQESTTVFVDPEAQLDSKIYSQLSDLGFRRSGEHLYRPKCRHCDACIPMRIPVERFSASRSQKRCWKRNHDLKVSVVDDIQTDEHYDLYEHYIAERHRDGEMYPATWEQFSSFLQPAWDITRYLEFRTEDGTLIGVAVTDQLAQGLSAIYTYYDPAEEARGLGVFGVLYQIDWARRMGLPYVFLGYWIKDCRKMNYKTRYRPYELFVHNRWVVFSESDT